MNPNSDNFSPEEIIGKVNELRDSLKPHEFAKLFCESANHQKTIDDVLKKILKNLLSHDIEARNSIKEMIHEIEKENWKIWLRKSGFAVWGIITFVLGIIATVIIPHFLPK